MNKTNIDWPGLDYTWNLVVGCKRDCSYCYAKKINARFRIIPVWTEPQFFENRILQPYKVKKPSKIFADSMSDICYWEDYWLDCLLAQANKCSWHTFMVLTKDVTVYSKVFMWPQNMWLGLTVEVPSNERSLSAIDALSTLPNKTFLSIEPISGMGTVIPKEIDLVIVGAMTGPGAKPPKKEWIESINHPNIHWKENIRKYL